MAAEDAPVPEAAAGTEYRVVRVTGDMDLEHAGELRETLAAALSQAPEGAEVIVDLRNSSFCDSAGLNTLLEARRQAVQSGHVLRLAAPSHQLLRLLELTGSSGSFPLDASVPG
ncbi:MULTISPECIES: STAS domain-containing protein [unclassified Streptomyces]|uniref:STAS domain-containing protein n=1 Tax=unclassified Streptomyces TaxID=2593676 RepID=UPI00044837AC|nr:STAS domain-containing protein [Streptomyces sp. PCS3-D2]WKV70399.1 STAS domain-containing protein [Streptomyces sp. PCS3-D2]